MPGTLSNEQVRILADALRGTDRGADGMCDHLFGFVPDFNPAIDVNMAIALVQCEGCGRWLDAEQVDETDGLCDPCFDAGLDLDADPEDDVIPAYPWWERDDD